MKLVKLQRKVPVKANTSKGNENHEPVQKIPHRVKVMTMFKMNEKVQSVAEELALRGELPAKQGNRVSSLIRIQIEEIKGKVRAIFPAALQFIGPGDR